MGSPGRGAAREESQRHIESLGGVTATPWGPRERGRRGGLPEESPQEVTALHEIIGRSCGGPPEGDCTPWGGRSGPGRSDSMKSREEADWERQ